MDEGRSELNVGHIDEILREIENVTRRGCIGDEDPRVKATIKKKRFNSLNLFPIVDLKILFLQQELKKHNITI